MIEKCSKEIVSWLAVQRCELEQRYKALWQEGGRYCAALGIDDIAVDLISVSASTLDLDLPLEQFGVIFEISTKVSHPDREPYTYITAAATLDEFKEIMAEHVVSVRHHCIANDLS